MKTSFASVLIIALGLGANAQNYSVDWHKVAGGGGASTSSQYAISGTIGQPDAGGPITGGNYSVVGGFWSLVAITQTPGAPLLHISHANNMVTVYWQNIAGWSLQQNSKVASLTGWSASSGVTTSNGTNYLSVANPAGNLYFRLKSP